MATDKQDYFPKVKEARERLLAQADDIIKSYLETIAEAREAGDFETAIKAQQWLIEHMKDTEGNRAIDTSVDKPQDAAKQTGPQINIGFKLGGLDEQQLALPPVKVETIE